MILYADTDNVNPKELPFYIGVYKELANVKFAHDCLKADYEDEKDDDVYDVEPMYFGADNIQNPAWIVQGYKYRYDVEKGRFGKLEIANGIFLFVEVWYKYDSGWEKVSEFKFLDDKSAEITGRIVYEKLKSGQAQIV